MNIKGWTLDELLGLISEGLNRLGDSGNNYGYFTLFDATDGGDIMAICRINICPREVRDELLELSTEAARLLSISRHVSSYQRDGLKGAIRAGSVILSLALPSEETAEAAMIYVAYKTGWITEEHAYELADISGNRLVDEELLASSSVPLS